MANYVHQDPDNLTAEAASQIDRDAGVGIVETKYFDLPEPLRLESGEVLTPVRLAYETYGELNEDGSNAILMEHALSGDAHVAGWHEDAEKPGWWDPMIGPGRAFDTDRYFVICSNIIGGCKGSTGPSSENPETGKPYGMSFPIVTVADMVDAQRYLIDHLGIEKLLCVSGGSLGGYQTLLWAVRYPERVQSVIPIATAAKLSAQGIAFSEVGRRAIMSDPDWNNGDYYETGKRPKSGLGLARMIGHITYLSDEKMQMKFGRRLRNKQKYGYDFAVDFEVESYLAYQGAVFNERFDANSYLYLTKSVDYFDLQGDAPSLTDAVKGITADCLLIAFSHDWRYPPTQLRELNRALKFAGVDSTFCEIESVHGHDAFLLEIEQETRLIRNFLLRSEQRYGK